MKKIIISLFLFLLSLLGFFSSGVIDSQDGFLYLAVARNIYYHGKPTAPVYEYDKYLNLHMNTYIGQDGQTYSPTGLGYSLALVPAVALTDLAYKYYHVQPTDHFPLENDWLILMLASFTNCFFGATLGIILFFYFKEIKLTTKQSLMMVFITIFATNLWVYTKHSFAHMMFITFFTLSLFLLRKYAQSSRKVLLIISGASYGICALTYNQTFVLTIMPMIVYYLLLQKQFHSLSLKKVVVDSLYFILGFVPLSVILTWFELARTPVSSRVTFYSDYIGGKLLHPPLSVAIEGIWGQLLSPGRSFFIYSPVVLTIIFFWHKIRSTIKPEFITLLVLSIIYIAFYSLQFSQGKPDQGIAALWHGESSWGPRYLIVLIPLSMIIVGHLYQIMTQKAKLIFFYPLVILGVYVQVLGILMPYQIKLHDLQDKFYINSTEYTAFAYSNLLPRYSSIFLMSKKLIKLAQNFPKTFNHGQFNTRFYDGIDFPFNVGRERWRVIDGKGYILFDNPDEDSIKNLSFGLINHPVDEATNSAILQFTLNNHPLLEKNLVLVLSERKLVEIPINNEYLKNKDNRLVIDVIYEHPQKDEAINLEIPENRALSLLKSSPQILGMMSFSINGKAVNLESLDVPYVSPLGPAMTNISYLNYGGLNKDPWKSWDIHTQIYERVPDFWWTKFLYYWDVPKPFFIILIILNISLITYSGLRLLTLIRKSE